MCPQVLQTCGSPDLVRSIISPHLSRDAVDFLRGHLRPKEMTIFELLGDGWTKPRYVIYAFLQHVYQKALQLKFHLLTLFLLLQSRVAQGSVRSSLLSKVS